MTLEPHTTYLIGFVATLPFAYGLAQYVIDAWKKVRLAEQEAAIKQQMIERGLSAAEMQGVLAAGSGPAAASGDLPAVMVEHEYEAADIGRVTARLAAVPDDLRPELLAAVRQMAESGSDYSGASLVEYIDARLAGAGRRDLQPA